MRQGRPILDVFDGASKQLHIPVFQRKYAWTQSQCERLFDDLEELVESGNPSHFFGSVVGKTDGSFDWQVIDGQQRLTTTSLLMLALVHAINDQDIDTENEHLSGNITDTYLLSHRSREPILKLKPIEDDRRAYEALFDKSLTWSVDSNITHNYRYFRERLKNTELIADQLWENGIRRLQIMLLDLEPHDHPQRIFETLNSTGVALTEMDKIRNLVLMDRPGSLQNSLYKNYWLPLEENVGRQGDWFFRWYLTAKKGTTPKKDSIYPAFKSFLKDSDADIQELMADIRKFSEIHRKFSTATTEFPDVNRTLRRANLILGDVTLPLLWNVYVDALAGIITEGDFNRCIKIVETHVFRRTTSSVGSNALNQIYATIYTEIRRFHKEGTDYADILAQNLLRRANTSGRIPNDEEFHAAFMTRNFFNTQANYKRYLFDFLENGTSKDVHDIASAIEAGDLTIEHVMPQTLTPSWRKMLGEHVEEIHETWKDRLGNLTVSAYNSSYSNSSFATKKTMANGFNDTPYRLNEYIKRQDLWTEKEMETRTRQYADKALEYWPLRTTDFVPPAKAQEQEPLGTDYSFTNRVISGFQLGEEVRQVEDWSSMIEQVLGLLAIDHGVELREIADTPGVHLTSTAKPYGSKVPRKIADGLYVQVNHATAPRLESLRRIFNHLEMDPDELVFTLRPAPRDERDNVAAQEAPRTPHKFAELTKYLPRLEKVATTSSDQKEIETIATEFAESFAPFAVSDPESVIGSGPVAEFGAKHNLAQCTADELLAYLTKISQLEKQTGFPLIPNLINEGTLFTCLHRLEVLG